MIEIKNVCKTYGGEKNILDNISFNVNDGEIFAFIGHNGAGKTTTIKSIVGISNISKLPTVGAIILVVISVGLTMIAGLIPAKFAAKRDPVEALRTE